MPEESQRNLRSRTNTTNKEKANINSAQQTQKTTKPATVNSRLSSTTSSRTPAAVAQNKNLSDTVHSLESRLTSLETLVSQLTSENSELRKTVASLQLEVEQCNNRAQQHRSSAIASETNVSLDQQDLNSNIVIRGVDVKEDTSESHLLAVYEGLRSHLNISSEADLAPISVTVLSSNPTKANTSRPIKVQLSSLAAKVKFLQVRRAKKDIFPSDIGINDGARRPILISEQLTRSNQELLYQARSLRGQDRYKFVWSTNGQILARQKENTKVIRIVDTVHVNRLRADFNLVPLPEHGRLHASTTFQHDSSHS